MVSAFSKQNKREVGEIFHFPQSKVAPSTSWRKELYSLLNSHRFLLSVPHTPGRIWWRREAILTEGADIWEQVSEDEEDQGEQNSGAL